MLQYIFILLLYKFLVQKVKFLNSFLFFWLKNVNFPKKFRKKEYFKKCVDSIILSLKFPYYPNVYNSSL